MRISPGDRVLVRLPKWLALADEVPSRELVGTVARVTHRAILIDAVPSGRAVGYCLMCAAKTDANSPYCAEHTDALEAAPRALWLPVSKIEVTSPTDVDSKWDKAATTASAPATATVTSSEIRVATRYEHREIAKSVPGHRWRGAQRSWAYPATAATASALAEAFSEVGLRTDEGFRALLDEAARVEEAAAHKTADDLPDVPGSKTSAWTHQRQTFWFARELKAAGLFLDMGTGKSKVAVDLCADRGHTSVLIVAPLSACRVWPGEFDKHAGVDYDVIDLTRKRGVPRKTEAAKEHVRLAQARGKPYAIIVNYESAWRDPFSKWALSGQWDLVVLDESHRVRTPSAKASIFASKLTKKSAHRLALTGTPMPHSPLDVYSQYRFLDPGIFGTSFNAFKQRFAVWGGYGDYECKGYTMMPEMTDRAGNRYPNPHYQPDLEREWNSKLWSIAHQVASDDVLDLPERHHIIRTCELSAKARKIYKQLDEDMYAEWADGRLTVDNALSRLLRLAQAANGFLVDEDTEEIRDIDDAKVKLLAEILGDSKSPGDLALDEPVVVFCRFRHDLDAVEKVCADSGRAYGELSGRRRDALTDDAKMSPHVDVAGVQIQAGGVGIDLTRAAYCIYFSKDFNLGSYDQSIKRVHRPGQDRPVTYLHLQTEDTVDQVIDAALAQRKNVVTAVLRDLRARHGEDVPDDEEERPDDKWPGNEWEER